MKQFKLCSDCYLISSGLMESTLVKKQISILHLPWCEYSDGLDDFLFNNVIYDRLSEFTSSKFENIIKNIDKNFEPRKILDSLKSLQHCFESYNGYIIETYGFTKVPELGDYILVMRYASGGDLHKHLQKNFTNITWNQKIDILNQVSNGCWDPDPKKRPSIKEIHSAFCLWALIAKYKAKFGQAEAKRKKLIESKKLGPEFAEKHHSEAIYTSRALIALISKCSSVYSSSTISFGSNYISELDTESLSSTTLDFNYISAELEFDISTESLSSQNLNSMIQKFSTVLDSNYISTELELDIDTESSSSQNLSSTIQKFSTSLKRRRIDVDVEAHDNYVAKHIKTS
ncbi:kinase-like domain-containing protein [Rhizophagus irregularis DAOM 181602=DAOM 197198]|nr:kinase-like domain-containing protein [Rhizophagus irregularis DAOM 181602=DAOM 197198]